MPRQGAGRCQPKTNGRQDVSVATISARSRNLRSAVRLSSSNKDRLRQERLDAGKLTDESLGVYSLDDVRQIAKGVDDIAPGVFSAGARVRARTVRGPADKEHGGGHRAGDCTLKSRGSEGGRGRPRLGLRRRTVARDLQRRRIADRRRCARDRTHKVPACAPARAARGGGAAPSPRCEPGDIARARPRSEIRGPHRRSR